MRMVNYDPIIKLMCVSTHTHTHTHTHVYTHTHINFITGS